MQIAIDCRSFQYRDRHSGVALYSRNLIQSLIELNNGHRKLVPFVKTFTRQRSHSLESPFGPLAGHRGFRMIGWGPFQLKLTRRSIDLFHILECVPYLLAPADRMVVTVYDLTPLLFPDHYLPWYKPRHFCTLWGHFRLLKKAAHLIAISHHTKADLVRLLGIPRDRISVIYPGVSEAFHPLTHSEGFSRVITRYRIRRPFVLYVGSFDFRKNIPVLLKAFARFQARVKGTFQLVFVGGYTEPPGLTPSLRVVRCIPLRHLVAFYNAAAMVVYPSLYEGFGFPPLEAMACGTPVIASDVSSLPEVTDGSALLVNPHDHEALSEGMYRLAVDDEMRKTLVQKGLVRAREFNWSKCARETLAVYDKVMG